MKELLKFKDLCVREITNADLAAREAAQRIKIIGAIPAELHERAQLRPAEAKVLLANAESAANKITNFVMQVQLAWIDDAQKNNNKIG